MWAKINTIIWIWIYIQTCIMDSYVWTGGSITYLVLVLSFLQTLNSPMLSNPTLQKSESESQSLLLWLLWCFLPWLDLFKVVRKTFLHPEWIICTKFAPSWPLSFFWGLGAHSTFLGVLSLLKQWHSFMLWVVCVPHASCSGCNAIWSSPFWPSWESRSWWTHPSSLHQPLLSCYC